MKLHTKILAGLMLSSALTTVAVAAPTVLKVGNGTVIDSNSKYTVPSSGIPGTDSLPYSMDSGSTLIWNTRTTLNTQVYAQPSGAGVTGVTVNILGNLTPDNANLMHSENTGNIATVILPPSSANTSSVLNIDEGGWIYTDNIGGSGLYVGVAGYGESTETGDITINNNGTILVGSRGNKGRYFGILGENKGNLNVNNTGNITLDVDSASTGDTFGITDLSDDLVSGSDSGAYISNIQNSGTLSITDTGGSTDPIGIYISQGSTFNNPGNLVITSASSGTAEGVEFLSRNSPTTNGVFSNTGTIKVTNTNSGGTARGILLRNNTDGTNTATGTITVSGVNAQGVYLDGRSDYTQSNITFENSGTINVSGTGNVVGIVAGGGYVTVTNKGTINAGKGNVAIAFTGADLNDNNVTNSTLNYYTTGNINGGKILFSTSESNKLQIFASEAGVGQNIYFEGNADVSIADPMLAVKTQTNDGVTEVTIVDAVPNVTPHVPANNALSKTNAGIVGRGIGQLVSDMNNHIYNNHMHNKPHQAGFNMWVDSYGENKHRPKDGGVHRIHTKFGGLTFGADKAVSDKTTAGFFVGALKSHMDIGLGATTKVKSSGALVGAYGNTMVNDVLLNGILEVGYIHHKRERSTYESDIDDISGKTIVKASNHEYFVSPAVTVAKKFKAGDTDVIPSLTVRYTGQKVSKLNEGDAAIAHTVKGRFVSSAGSRAQLMTTKAFNDKSSINFYGGLEYTKLLTNKVKLENLGSGNQSETVKVKKIADTDAFFGVKLNHLVNKAVAYVGVEGKKGLKKGDGGKNYSVALSLGADF